MNTAETHSAPNHQRVLRVRRILTEQPGAERSKRRLASISLIGALAAFGLAVSPVHSAELSAIEGQSIHLGRLQGVVYYTNENDGYRVVATVADSEAGAPVRFSATLAEGQSARISVPGKAGEPDQTLEMSRSGDRLTVIEAGSTSSPSTGAIGE